MKLKTLTIYSIFIILILPFISSCKNFTGSKVKKVTYNTNQSSIPAFSLDFCNKYTIPTSSRHGQHRDFNKAENAYKRKFAHYLLDTIATRTFYIQWPPSIEGQPTDKTITADDLSSLLGENSICTKQKENTWWNTSGYQHTLNNVEPIEKAVQRFNSEQVHELIYPAFIKTNRACHKVDDEIEKKFKQQTVGQLKSQLEKLCQDHSRLEEFYLNPGLVAGFFLTQNKDIHLKEHQKEEYRRGFCTAQKKNADHLRKKQEWNEVEPWIIAGGAIAAGTLANLGTGGLAGQVIDWGAFGISLGANLAKYQYALMRFATLEEMEADLDIPQGCSQDQVKQELEHLKSYIFYDVVGQAAGFTIGWAAPGIGRGIAGLFRAGKASFKSIATPFGHKLYIVIPGINHFFRLPSKDIFITQIRSGFDHVKNILPPQIHRHIDRLMKIISDKYDSLIKKNDITIAKNTNADPIPNKLSDDVFNNAYKLRPADETSFIICKAGFGLKGCGLSYPLNYKASPKTLEKFIKDAANEYPLKRVKSKELKKVAPNLLPEEIAAIFRYTRDYIKINKALRGGSLTESQKIFADTLASGLRKLGGYKGTVYRVSSTSSDEVIKAYKSALKSGDAIQELGFTSAYHGKTSHFRGKYIEYFTEAKKAGKIKKDKPLLEYVIESKTAAKIEKISKYPEESEALFAAGTSFKIVDMKKSNLGWVITMKEL